MRSARSKCSRNGNDTGLLDGTKEDLEMPEAESGFDCAMKAIRSHNLVQMTTDTNASRTFPRTSHTRSRVYFFSFTANIHARREERPLILFRDVTNFGLSGLAPSSIPPSL